MTKRCTLPKVYELRNIHGIVPPVYQNDDRGLDAFRNDDGSYAGKKYVVNEGRFLPEALAERIINYMLKCHDFKPLSENTEEAHAILEELTK